MVRKSYLILTVIAAMLTVVTTVKAADIMFYTGHTNPGWIAEAQMRKDADKIIAEVKGLFKNVADFDDKKLKEIGQWCKDNTGDKELDVIVMFGCTPSTLYPNPNAKPDGSPLEEFLDDGNLIINVADYVFY
jgi:hypothetical protein